MPPPRYIIAAIAVLCACVISSCASHQWRIVLKDGQQFQASSKPELQKKTGYYRYQNMLGRDALLRAEEVLMVEQL